MDQNKTLVHVNSRILVRIDLEQKNGVTLSDGTELRLIRQANNLDRAYTSQVKGQVISAENIPTGATILFHFNAIHDVNKVFNHSTISGEEIASGIAIYSFEERECFLWQMPGDKEWQPVGPFVIAERVFEPYTGILQGIEPKQIKNVLYIKTGELAGNVCHVLNASDYRLIFRNLEGKEEVLIRCRHFPNTDEPHEREEITAINHDLTELVRIGKLLTGLTPSDAKPIRTKDVDSRPSTANERAAIPDASLYPNG